ncbi:chromosomal replication initiator protein DnaA, partial [Bartonella sp. M0193]
MSNLNGIVSGETKVNDDVHHLVAQDEGDELFARVMAQLKVHVGNEAYTSWFGRLQLDEFSRSQVRLSVPTAFLRSWITNHYATILTELWRQECPTLLRVDVVVRGMNRVVKHHTPRKEEETHVQNHQENMVVSSSHGRIERFSGEAQQSVFGSPLDSRYTFDTFVEGPS